MRLSLNNSRSFLTDCTIKKEKQKKTKKKEGEKERKRKEKKNRVHGMIPYDLLKPLTSSNKKRIRFGMERKGKNLALSFRNSEEAEQRNCHPKRRDARSSSAKRNLEEGMCLGTKFSFLS